MLQVVIIVTSNIYEIINKLEFNEGDYMKRHKRIIGLCGREFVQSEPMQKGQIHMDCGICWIRTNFQKDTIQIECDKVCTKCIEEKKY